MRAGIFRERRGLRLAMVEGEEHRFGWLLGREEEGPRRGGRGDARCGEARRKDSPQSGVAIGSTSSRSSRRSNRLSMQMAHDASSSRSPGILRCGLVLYRVVGDGKNDKSRRVLIVHEDRHVQSRDDPCPLNTPVVNVVCVERDAGDKRRMHALWKTLGHTVACSNLSRMPSLCSLPRCSFVAETWRKRPVAPRNGSRHSN